MPTTHIDKVKKYFESTIIDYKIYWALTGSEDLAMHFGYYENGIRSPKDALTKMNDVLAKLINISTSDRVVDAGCGYGGSAIWIAKNIGCEVVGLTIVPSELREAKKFAEKYSLSDKVSFRAEDYVHTSFLDNSFSVVWGLESIVHAESKKDFIDESYRLLKTGGRILISEYMLRESPSLSDNDKKVIEPWLKGWAMPSLLTPGEYKSLLSSAGFKNIKVHDLTENVCQLRHRFEIISKFAFYFVNLLHKLKRISAEHYGNIEAYIAQSKALKMGLWRYTVVTAEKL